MLCAASPASTKDSGRQESDLDGVAVGQRLFGRRNRLRASAPARCSAWARAANFAAARSAFLDVKSLRGALLKNSCCVRETTFENGQVAKTGRREGRAERVDRSKLLVGGHCLSQLTLSQLGEGQGQQGLDVRLLDRSRFLFRQPGTRRA